MDAADFKTYVFPLLFFKRISDVREEEYQAALVLNPIDNRAYFGLAMLDEQQGRFADALREYRAGLETDPRNAVALAAMQRLAERASQ